MTPAHNGRFLGRGRSCDFEHLLKPGEDALEVGKEVYAVRSDRWCNVCDGAGCKTCKFTGEKKGKKK